MSYGPFTKAHNRTIFVEPTKGIHDQEVMFDDAKQAIILNDLKDIMRGKKVYSTPNTHTW